MKRAFAGSFDCATSFVSDFSCSCARLNASFSTLNLFFSACDENEDEENDNTSKDEMKSRQIFCEIFHVSR